MARYWSILEAGEDSITRREAATAATFVPAYGSVPSPGHFDRDRFGIASSEALLTDPQQRLLLEAVDEALTTANVDRAGTMAVSVYAGVGHSDYERWVGSALAGRPGVDAQSLEVTNRGDYAATRVAYRLGLQGAAVTVQSACSTALTAVHLAVQDLLGHSSDLAVAAVSSVRVPAPGGYDAPLGGIGSPDGVCRPFDAAAGGSVPGDGVGAVVFKRLADAVSDGDEIWAVVRGSAMNNDGWGKSGFAGVDAAAQAEVIRAALDVAGLGPGDIDYVEAHGSGTRIGDSTEWSALAEVFAEAGHPVHVGAVKGGLGHLREAAGLAGFAKAVLSLRHRRLAATPHFERLPADLAARSGPLRPLGEALDWPAVPGRPRRAGVSAFGLGGTNCHVVLEEAPAAPVTPPSRDPELLLLSSHHPDALDVDLAALRDHVGENPSRIADAAWTTQTARHRYPHRAYAVVRSPDEVAAAFGGDRLRIQRGHATRRRPRGRVRAAGPRQSLPGHGRRTGPYGPAVRPPPPGRRGRGGHADRRCRGPVVRHRAGRAGPPGRPRGPARPAAARRLGARAPGTARGAPVTVLHGTRHGPHAHGPRDPPGRAAGPQPWRMGGGRTSRGRRAKGRDGRRRPPGRPGRDRRAGRHAQRARRRGGGGALRRGGHLDRGRERAGPLRVLRPAGSRVDAGRPAACRGVHHVARGHQASLPHTAVGGRRRPARRGSAPRGPGAGPHPHRFERARRVAGRGGTRTRLLA
ncbi:hypothetical protein SANTM175S_06237 [Streptomyces antimycoticus]